MKNHKLVIFDKDGTLCRNKKNHKNFIHSATEQELIPGVMRKCRLLKADGVKMGIATNQGGVAFGYLTNVEAYAILMHAARLIEADCYRLCPHHPAANHEVWGIESFCRKPNPGMLLSIMVELEVAPTDTLMVGDREEDQEAARNAGCDFMWAHEFFGWELQGEE